MGNFFIITFYDTFIVCFVSYVVAILRNWHMNKESSRAKSTGHVSGRDL